MGLFSNDIKHPDEFSLVSGETQLIGQLEAIEQSIGLILRTARGELFGDPEFGCNLYTYLYKYDGEQLYNLIKTDVSKAINRWENRVYVNESDVSCESDLNDMKITITVDYHLRNTEYVNTYVYSVNKRYREQV